MTRETRCKGMCGRIQTRNCGVRALLFFGLSLPLLALSGCKASPAKLETKVAEDKVAATKESDPADLQAAMDKLAASLEKPTAPFHVAFKKSGTEVTIANKVVGFNAERLRAACSSLGWSKSA